MARLSSPPALWLLFFLPAAAQDPPRTGLAWKPAKGQVLRFDTTSSAEMEGPGTELRQAVSLRLRLEAVAVGADGIATYKVRHEKARIAVKGPREAEFDSEKDQEPKDLLGRIYKGLIGRDFTMKMDPRGRIESVEGYAGIVREIVKDTPEGEGLVGMLVEQGFSDERFLQEMQSRFPVLPPAPAAKGESWETSRSMSLHGLATLKLATRASLKQIREASGEAVLGVETKMEIDKGEEGPLGGAELTEGTEKGEAVFRIEAGILASSRSTTSITLLAGGREIAVTSKSETRLVEEK